MVNKYSRTGLYQNLKKKKNRGRIYSKINTVAAFSFLSTSPSLGGKCLKNQLRHPPDSVIDPSEQLGPAVILLYCIKTVISSESISQYSSLKG